MSLDLLLSSCEISSRSSSVEQSSRNIEFLLAGLINDSNDANFIWDKSLPTMESFNTDAIELKYLLNSLHIILLSKIFLLSMIMDGVATDFVLPRISFIICQVFLRSCLVSTTYSIAIVHVFSCINHCFQDPAIVVKVKL